MQDKHKWLLRAVVLVAVAAWLTRPYWLPAQKPAENSAKAELATPKVDTHRMLGSLRFEPCTLAKGTESLMAFCTRLQVPENHAEPKGRQLSLAMAWLPASGEAEPDPLFMLAGGPGQGARESFPSIAGAFTEARKNRHIILLDQRGTGDSNPLKCLNEKGQNDYADDETSAEAAAAFAQRCADSFAGKNDVRQFTSMDAIDDLDLARKALGAETINLVGISYGTRVAQLYAKKYPAQTRTITIDGVAPLDVVLGQEHAKNLETSLDLQFKRCSEQPDCLAKVGDPRVQLQQLLTTLKRSGVPVSYRDATTGEWKQGEFTAGHLAMLTRLLAYQPMAASLLPHAFSEANKGRVESLMAVSEMVSKDITDQIMHGMQLSVMCSEDAGDYVNDPEDAQRLLGTGLVDFMKIQCAVWPHKARPADFRTPLNTAVPALVLSGEFDPVTPPRYGDMVAKHLSKAKHIVAKGQGHNVLPVGCVPKLFARFLQTADAKGLDTRCVDTLTYAPMFTGYYGWEP